MDILKVGAHVRNSLLGVLKRTAIDNLDTSDFDLWFHGATELAAVRFLLVDVVFYLQGQSFIFVNLSL